MIDRDQTLIDRFVHGSLSITEQTEFDSRFSSDPGFSEKAVQALGVILGPPDSSYLSAMDSRLETKASSLWAKAGYTSPLSGTFGVRALTAALLVLLGTSLVVMCNRPAQQVGTALSAAAPRVMLAFRLPSCEGPSWSPRNVLRETDLLPSSVTRACSQTSRPAKVVQAAAPSLTEESSGDIPTTLQGRTLRIRIEVPRDVAGRVTLYDSDGKLVRHLFEGPMPAGTWALDWDQKNNHGAHVGPGAYIVQIEADGKVLSGRVSVAPGS